jgi:hypothetical protein
MGGFLVPSPLRRLCIVLRGGKGGEPRTPLPLEGLCIVPLDGRRVRVGVIGAVGTVIEAGVARRSMR